MKLNWQLLSCLKILFVVFFFCGCEQKPLIINTGDNGLKVDVITSFSFNTITEQRDSLNIGNSFKLYLGQIDSIRNSQILFRINPELLLESNVCNDSTEVLNSIIKLRSTAQIYNPIGEPENELTNPGLGRENYTDSTQFNAYFISQLDSIYGWVENSISISETIDINQFESIPLDISIDQFNLNIHLESLFNTDPSKDTINICNFDNPVFILLADGNESRFTEFFSSDFLGASVVPVVNSEVEYLQTTQTEINKFEITSIESEFLTENNIIATINEDGFYSGEFYNETPENIIDNPYLISMEDTAQNIELLKLNIELNDNVGDSSNSINLFFHSVEFSNQAINSALNPNDPALDNWNEEDSTGTDGNNTYDFGEFYFDCGIDNLCDEDEPGYFPNGLENNNKWDDGEIYLDCGPDSLCNVDEVGYDPILNIDPAGDDYNPDPNNDNWSNSSLIDSFYVYFEVVNIDSIECSTDYEGTNYYSYLTEADSNLYLSDLWCGDSDLYCSSCDTLINYSYTDSTLEYLQTGTENNYKWDFIDLNENGVFDYEDSYEEFLDLGFDNYPEQDGNEFSDPFENNGQWDFDDLNENGEYDLGEPHENFTDCGVDNICDIDEIGYNPNGTEGNSQYDNGEYYEDCGLDLVCGEIPDIDDLVLDPNGDNWNYLDSTGTEGNNLWDSLEVFYDWGTDQLPDSLELPFQTTGGGLNHFVGTNNWEFLKEPIDTVFEKPEIGDNDLVLWISSIGGSGEEFEITISLNSMSDISHIQFELGHIPYFESSEELINETFNHTNYSVATVDGMNFINDISAYPKSIIEIDSTNFHLNYSDNFITRIEIPELDEIIENNFNATISKALIHFEIDSSNSNYFVPEAGIKISFSKFNDYDLDSFNSAKTLLSSQIIKDQTSVEIDFTTEMQKLLTGESTNNGFVFEASRESYNFSHLTFFNELDSLNKPKLEIMIIK